MLFSFSYCGYANAGLFVEINEEDIKDVESFVSNELLSILSTKAEESISANDTDEVVIDEEQMTQHYGQLFAFNPAKFKFLPGDRKCIQLVKNLIQRHIQKYGRKRAMNHFTDKSELPKQSYKRLKMSEPNHCADECSEKSADISSSELESKLYTNVKQKIAKLGFSSSILKCFEKSFVQIRRDEKGNIYGEVFCVVCHIQANPPNSVNQSKIRDLKPKKIFLRTKAGRKSWVISNFASHLETHKDVKNHAKNESFQLVDVEVLSPECNEYELPQDSKSLADFSSASIEAICNSSVAGTTRIEKVFNEQISTQNIHMWQAAILNCETFEKVECVFKDGTTYLLEVVQIPGDGNCLFSSIAHQLFKQEVNSAKHIQSTNALRADVVKYIEENIAEFLHELRGHLYELKDSDTLYKLYGLDEFDDLDEACKHFVTNWLKNSGVWGGGESLKAITHIYNVNILIFNENGPVYIVANPQQNGDRTIAISYRLGHNGLRNHYVSVCNIAGIDIYNIAKEVIGHLNLNLDSDFELCVDSSTFS